MANSSGYQGNYNPGFSAAIANGQSTSGAILLNGFVPVGIQMPAAFTGTAITFLGSLDGVLFQPIFSTTSGTALSYTVAAAHFVALDPAPFQGVAQLKIVSGSTEAAARTLGLAVKGL